jgi:hypothetical protein
MPGDIERRLALVVISEETPAAELMDSPFGPNLQSVFVFNCCNKGAAICVLQASWLRIV